MLDVQLMQFLAESFHCAGGLESIHGKSRSIRCLDLTGVCISMQRLGEDWEKGAGSNESGLLACKEKAWHFPTCKS